MIYHLQSCNGTKSNGGETTDQVLLKRSGGTGEGGWCRGRGGSLRLTANCKHHLMFMSSEDLPIADLRDRGRSHRGRASSRRCHGRGHNDGGRGWCRRGRGRRDRSRRSWSTRSGGSANADTSGSTEGLSVCESRLDISSAAGALNAGLNA